MVKEVEIVKASVKDMSFLIKLRKELFAEEEKHYPKALRAYKRIVKNADEILRKDFSKKIHSRKTRIFVAKINNEIVGYIEGSVWKKDSFLEVKKIGDVNQIIVTRKHRKQGIAKRLYSEMKKWFAEEGCELQELYVLLGNPAAELYRKWGYKTTVLRMTKGMTRKKN